MTKRKNFQPSAPVTGLWIVALILGALGILAHYTPIGQLSRYNYEMLLIAFLLLAVGTAYRRV
ncbi:MAG: hypothetical protein H7246_16835 [Phycisphaerae bacterium]|nr:hypothetical protein [Saprospiraceae bacterium]